MRPKNSKKKKLMLFKVNFKEAYDSVDWGVIRRSHGKNVLSDIVEEVV